MTEQTTMPWAPPPEDADPEETLVGKVVRTLYEGDQGFRVVRVEVEGRAEPDVWVGTMPPLRDGMTVTGTGRHEPDPKRDGAERFKVSLVVPVMPKTAAGLYDYLASGAIPGVGPSLARRIVDRFGEATVEILDHTPERLLEVDGIGDKTRAKITTAWVEKRAISDIMMFLVSHGATPALAFKIHDRYGSGAIAIILGNPFKLARDVHGVGFATADRIARSCGVALDSPERDQAGVLETLYKVEDKGHTYVPRHKLAADAGILLGRTDAQADAAIGALAKHGDVALDTTLLGGAVVMRTATSRLECNVATAITTLLTTPVRAPRRHPDQPVVTMADAAEQAIAAFEQKTGFTLADAQREAVRLAASSKVLILTGGPGCGKTAVTRALLELYRIADFRFALCAPTGRAAKRMSEATGAPAKTIHRTLGFDPQDRGFFHREERPLDEEVIVVDETSMLALDLCASLLAAIRQDARVVLVGDIDQLPSVGAGAVLRDLIGSGVIPTVRLTHIFRQAAGSAIVDNAHRVNRGELPVTATSPDGEFHWIQPQDEQDAAEKVLRIVTERIPERWGLDPKTEIQVLVPMHKGHTGTFEMNRALQATLNPPGPAETVRDGIAYRVGDRVMQTSNDAMRDVYNGDQGFITAIGEDDAGKPTMTVVFDGSPVVYLEKQFRQVRLAYAITTHKFQGSEAPAVVVVMLSRHYMMLSRPWLYTSLTRGKQRVVLVADARAVRTAVTSMRKEERLTLLADRIRAGAAGDVSPLDEAVLATGRQLRGGRR